MDQLLSQGIELMLLGMGLVFSFLIVLVFTTAGMSTLVNRFFPERHKPAPASSQPAPVPVDDTGVSPKTLAIIREAIRQHREGSR